MDNTEAKFQFPGANPKKYKLRMGNDQIFKISLIHKQ